MGLTSCDVQAAMRGQQFDVGPEARQSSRLSRASWSHPPSKCAGIGSRMLSLVVAPFEVLEIPGYAVDWPCDRA